jgi:hypothetical protein
MIVALEEITIVENCILGVIQVHAQVHLKSMLLFSFGFFV